MERKIGSAPTTKFSKPFSWTAKLIHARATGHHTSVLVIPLGNVLIYIEAHAAIRTRDSEGYLLWRFLPCLWFALTEKRWLVASVQPHGQPPPNTLTVGSSWQWSHSVTDSLSCHHLECLMFAGAINLVCIFAFANCKFPFYRCWPDGAVNTCHLRFASSSWISNIEMTNVALSFQSFGKY